MKPTGICVAAKIQANIGDVKVVKSKKALKSASKITVKTPETKLKPLAGKVFYLDLPLSKVSESLEKDIQSLGGAIERFLSKDISYLISNKKEAKFAQTFGRNSPVPSPESAPTGNSSPHPSSRRGSQDGSSHRTVHMSRGKSLVKKVIKEQELIPVNSILSNALAWGVKILYIDDIKSYIEKKKKELSLVQKSSASVSASVKEKGKSRTVTKEVSQKTKAGRLKKPFIKVEDRSRHYRPLYQQFSNFPVISYQTPKHYSPFDLDKKNGGIVKHAVIKTRSKEHKMTNSERDYEMVIRPMQALREKKKKKGYCECCMMKYEDLAVHLKSEQHRTFSESMQYQVVDNVISQLTYDFEEYKNDNIKRTKCSVGVFLHSSTPIINITQKEGGLDVTQKGSHLSTLLYSSYTTAAHSQKDNQNSEAVKTVTPVAVRQASFFPDMFCSFSSCCRSNPCEVVSKSNTINIESGKHDETFAGNLNATDKKTHLGNFEEPVSRKDKKRHEEICNQKNAALALCQDDGNVSHCVKSGTVGVNGSQGPHKDKPQLNTTDERMLSECQSETVAYQKRKQNSVGVCPAKYSRFAGSDPACYMIHENCVKRQIQNEKYLALDTKYLLHNASPLKQGNHLEGNSSDNSPCRKLHRKVKFSSGRSKRGNQKQNVYYRQNEEIPVTEEAVSISPVKTIFELFQTSDGSASEFLGFTGSSIQENSSSQMDLCQERALWSLFAHSSYSSFHGF